MDVGSEAASGGRHERHERHGNLRFFVGQVGIEQEGLRAFGKGLSDLLEVESSKGQIRS
jgi:hypothetical protein